MTIEHHVLNIMRETRPMLLKSYGVVDELGRKNERAHSVVTELDIAVEKHLAYALGRAESEVGFVGEELGGDRTAERFWLCDPIDGPAHYVRGLPYCTSMIARIEDHVVTFGAIYDFVHDVMYVAKRGHGAFANNVRLRVSARPAQDAYVFCETNLNHEHNMFMYRKLRMQASILNTLSSGYEHVLVASGRIEGRVNVQPWGSDYDYAPGSLLVSEAGGIVANLGSRSYDYRNCDYVAASPAVHALLTEGEHALFPLK